MQKYSSSSIVILNTQTPFAVFKCILFKRKSGLYILILTFV